MPVIIHGSIAPDQVNWADTLRQNFEGPREWEVIFSGNVFVSRVEDMDEDKSIKLGLTLPKVASVLKTPAPKVKATRR